MCIPSKVIINDNNKYNRNSNNVDHNNKNQSIVYFSNIQKKILQERRK